LRTLPERSARRSGDLLNLAGAVEVPAEKRGAAWDEVRRRTRAARARSEP